MNASLSLSPYCAHPAAFAYWTLAATTAGVACRRGTPGWVARLGMLALLAPTLLALPPFGRLAGGVGLATWSMSLLALARWAACDTRSRWDAAARGSLIILGYGAVEAWWANHRGAGGAALDLLAPSASLRRLAHGAIEVDAVLALALPGIVATLALAARRRLISTEGRRNAELRSALAGLVTLLAAVGAAPLLPLVDGSPGGVRGLPAALRSAAGALDQPVLITLVAGGRLGALERDTAASHRRALRALARHAGHPLGLLEVDPTDGPSALARAAALGVPSLDDSWLGLHARGLDAESVMPRLPDGGMATAETLLEVLGAMGEEARPGLELWQGPEDGRLPGGRERPVGSLAGSASASSADRGAWEIEPSPGLGVGQHQLSPRATPGLALLLVPGLALCVVMGGKRR